MVPSVPNSKSELLIFTPPVEIFSSASFEEELIWEETVILPGGGVEVGEFVGAGGIGVGVARPESVMVKVSEKVPLTGTNWAKNWVSVAETLRNPHVGWSLLPDHLAK